MRVKKTIERPATTEEVLDYCECDLCGKKTENIDRWPSSLDEKRKPWSMGKHNLRRTTVEMEIGDLYPESFWANVTAFDICTDCFKTKLIPWFESQGAKPRTEELDW